MLKAYRSRCIFLLLFTLYSLASFSQKHDNKPEEKLISDAADLYKSGEYVKALPLYSQLLSLYPKNPYYSYRFGVCLLFGDRRDVEKPLKYLSFAAEKSVNENKVFYHLALAYHYNYRFPEAIKEYEKYQNVSAGDKLSSAEANYGILMCRNGMSLLSKVKDLYVLNKMEVKRKDFYRSYDLSDFAGSFLAKPDFFKTKLDKKKKDNSIIFYSDTNSVIYFSSYGKKGETGRDIYRSYKLPDGKWGTPERLSNTINSLYDEDYPYILPDGKTLYFCSKGHNTMGGYDIFKSVWDTVSKEWGTPENLDFAINSPFDDILFVTDNAQQYAYFSSVRNSVEDYIMVYKVRIDKRPETSEAESQALAVLYKNDSTYSESLSVLQEKAKLDVNVTPQEMNAFNAGIKQNQFSNKISKIILPEGISSKSIVDTAFLQHQIVKTGINKINQQISNVYELSEKKREELNSLNVQITAAEEKAAKVEGALREEQLKKINVLKTKADLVRADVDNCSYIANTLGNVVLKRENKATKYLADANRIKSLVDRNNIDSAKYFLTELLADITETDTSADVEVIMQKEMQQQVNEKLSLASEFRTLINRSSDEIETAQEEAAGLREEASNAGDPELKKEYLSQAEQLDNEVKEKQSSIDKYVIEENKAKKEAENISASFVSVAHLTSLIEGKEVVTDSSEQLVVNGKQLAVSSEQLAVNSEQLQVSSKRLNSNKEKLQVYSGKLILKAEEYEGESKEALVLANRKKAFAENERIKADSVAGLIKAEGPSKTNASGADLLAITESNYVNASREAVVLTDIAVRLKAKATELKSQADSITEMLKLYNAGIPLKDTNVVFAESDSVVDVAEKILVPVNVSELIKDDNNLKAGNLNETINNVSKEVENLESVVKVNESKAAEKREKAGLTSGAGKRQKLLDEAIKIEAGNDSLSYKLKVLQDSVRQMKLQVSALQMQTDYSDRLYKTIKENEIVLKSNEKQPDDGSLTKSAGSNVSADLFYESYAPFAEAVEKNLTVKLNVNNTEDSIYYAANNKNSQIKDTVAKVSEIIPSEFVLTEKQESVQKKQENYSTEEGLIIYTKAEKISQVIVNLKMQVSVLSKKLSYTKDSASRDSISGLIKMLNNKIDSVQNVYQKVIVDNQQIKPENKIVDEAGIAKAEENILSNARNNRMKADSIMVKLPDKKDKTRSEQMRNADSLYKSGKSELIVVAEMKNAENTAAYEREKLISEILLQKKDSNVNIQEAIMYSDEAENLFHEAALIRDSLNKPEVSLFYADTLAQRADRTEKQAILKQKVSVNIIRKKLGDTTNTEKLIAGIEKTEAQLLDLADAKDKEQQALPETSIFFKGQSVDSVQLNPVLAKGVIYRVQISALRELVDADRFLPLSPVTAEKLADKQFYYYLYGIFTVYEDAVATRDKLRVSGYSDAFIVAYIDGERVSFGDALKYQTGGAVGTAGVKAQQQQGASNAGIVAGINNNLGNAAAVSDVKDLFYTVQIGVFGSPRSKERLFNLDPLYYDRMENGNYRYFAGIFMNRQEAVTSREFIVNNYVPDAFVVAFYNGSKISLQEAAAFENKGVAKVAGNKMISLSQNQTVASLQQGTGEISSNPEQNGKPQYKVQTGAFRKEVSVEVLNNFKKIAGNDTVSFYMNSANLVCYTAGSFNTLNEAKTLRKTFIDSGIRDAFIVAFLNGRPISLNRAEQIGKE